MSNKKQKLWGYGVLIGSLAGAVLLGWLTLPVARGISGIPKQIKYQAPTGEQLVTTSQDSAPLADTEFEYQGHRYRLDVKIDQPNISPLAGSFITGKIQLLKDGSPAKEAPDFMVNSRAGITSGTPRDIPIVLVDLDTLNQQMEFSSTPNSTRLKINDQAQWFGGGMFSWYRLSEVGFTKNGNPSLSGPYLYTPWDKLFTSPQAFDTAGVLDLSTGQATFKYQHNGIRVASYLELTVSSYDKKIQSSRRVNFQDARRVTVPQPTNNSKMAEVSYEIVTSQPKLTADQSQRFSIGVVARKANGSINEDPLQRVRLTVMPSSVVFLPTAAQTNWNANSGSGLKITGTIQIDTSGKFIETDDTKYKYGSNLNHNGEKRGATLDDDPTAIYLDLISGKATVDFEYNGRPGPLPYLAITVQPADFFVPYKNWNTNPSAQPDFKSHMWDNLVKDCDESQTCPTWYADERAYVNAPPYHREAAGITYPPLPEQTDNPNPRTSDFINYPYPGSSSGQVEYFLYQNKWHTRAEFTDLVINATAVKLLPISADAGSSIQWAWWWFISLQLVQLTAWLIRMIIKKLKKRHGNS